MNKQYKFFKSKVKDFRKNISWDNVARQHITMYKNIRKDKSSKSHPVEMIRKNKS